MDITLISDTTVAVTTANGAYTEYDLPIVPSPEMKWDGSGNLTLTIKDKTYLPCAIAALTINSVAPANLAAAKVALRAVFPDPDATGTTSDLSNITTDVVISDSSKGLVQKSPNGTSMRLVFNNDGSISTTVI